MKRFPEKCALQKTDIFEWLKNFIIENGKATSKTKNTYKYICKSMPNFNKWRGIGFCYYKPSMWLTYKGKRELITTNEHVYSLTYNELSDDIILNFTRKIDKKFEKTISLTEYFNKYNKIYTDMRKYGKYSAILSFICHLVDHHDQGNQIYYWLYRLS